MKHSVGWADAWKPNEAVGLRTSAQPTPGVYLWLALLLFLPAAWLQAAPPSGKTPRVAVHLGALRDASRADVEVSLKAWAEELTHFLEVPTEIRFYMGMSDIQKDFVAERVNFVIAAGMDFARYFRPEELAEGFRGALQIDHTLMLLTRKDSGIADLDALAGKRVVLLKDDELSEVYLETVCLRQYKRLCKQVFAGIESVANSNLLILRLVFGKADLVVSKRNGFETARELNPQIGRLLLELARFPIKSGYCGLYNRKISPAFRQFSLHRIPDMHKEVRGRQVLEIFRLDRLELVGPEELRPFYQLHADYEALHEGKAPRKAER